MSELKKIGYVEDEQTAQLLAKMTLEKVGKFEVTMYSSGAEALEGLPNNVPDLLILDYHLGDMDGPTLLQKIREIEILSGIPFVFVTGKNELEISNSLKELGALEVFVKPFEPTTFPDQLRSLWQSRAN